MDVSLKNTPKNKFDQHGSRFIFSNLTTNGNDNGNSSMDESGIMSHKNKKKVIASISRPESLANSVQCTVSELKTHDNF